MALRPTLSELMDRKNRGVAGMLTHFQNLVMIATEPVPDEGALEAAAAQGLRLQVEMAALVSSAEDLLRLSRDMKELWLLGPLRGIKEDEDEGKMDEDAKEVGEMVQALLTQATDAVAK